MLGRVPSTASVVEGALRPRSFALLHWMPRSVPQDWHLHLLADHRVRLHTETPVALPITAAGLLGEITLFLLALRPYLDLLDETGVTALVADDQRGNSSSATQVAPTPRAPAAI
jgi:hypothetical protein